MIDGANNPPDDAIETAGRRVGIGASIMCIVFLAALSWLAVIGVVSIVWDALRVVGVL